MDRVRLAVLVGLAAMIVAVVPASAGGNDWGTWTFSGHGKSWSGTLIDAHRMTGVVIGLKSLPKYNSVTSFTLGDRTCKLSKPRGTGYCYYLDIPANTKLDWTLTTLKPVASSKGIVACIQYAGKFHCRYGNG